jgi:hypothetical protein
VSPPVLRFTGGLTSRRSPPWEHLWTAGCFPPR